MNSQIRIAYDMIYGEAFKEEFFYKKMSEIFFGYFSLKEGNEIKYDYDGMPLVFPSPLKRFIKESYPLFKELVYTSMESKEEKLNQIEYRLSHNNRANILTRVLVGKIRSGKDISQLLFDGLPLGTTIPKSFKDLCHLKDKKYIIFDTDIGGKNFQIAVFDLLRLNQKETSIYF